MALLTGRRRKSTIWLRKVSFPTSTQSCIWLSVKWSGERVSCQAWGGRFLRGNSLKCYQCTGKQSWQQHILGWTYNELISMLHPNENSHTCVAALSGVFSLILISLRGLAPGWCCAAVSEFPACVVLPFYMRSPFQLVLQKAAYIFAFQLNTRSPFLQWAVPSKIKLDRSQVCKCPVQSTFRFMSFLEWIRHLCVGCQFAFFCSVVCW